MKGKRILVFGGSGSLGKQLLSRLAADNTITVFSRDENKHWEIRNNIPVVWGVDFIVGDMRDYQAVEVAIKRAKPEVIIIASALKHVGTCENFPDESVKTNIIGVQNVVNACDAVGAPPNYSNNPNVFTRTVLMVSTDKACSPINVYGMCKAIAERIVLERARHAGDTKYVAVRYGNVLESRGSIVPLFKKQASNNDAFTVTHNDMTRFAMTLDDSIDLIVDAVKHGTGGQTWVPILKSMRIMDLAQIFSEKYEKPIKIIGIRSGEKIHEDLVNETEFLRTEFHQQRYIIHPAWGRVLKKDNESMRYTSTDDVLTKDELEVYLSSKGIFNDEFSGV